MCCSTDRKFSMDTITEREKQLSFYFCVVRRNDYSACAGYKLFLRQNCLFIHVETVYILRCGSWQLLAHGIRFSCCYFTSYNETVHCTCQNSENQSTITNIFLKIVITVGSFSRSIISNQESNLESKGSRRRP